MASTQDFIDFVCDQVNQGFSVRYRKMFGEYMIYINEKPLLLVCDNTVYVKKIDCISTLINESNTGYPYKGAKEHYIVDVEEKEIFNEIIEKLEKVIPVPVKKAKK